MRGKAKTFTATLERMPATIRWVIARVPFNVEKVWGTRGRPRVKGEINGFPFRTSLFPTRRGVHFLNVNKAVQKGAGVTAGMKARFRLELDTEERVAKIPPQLKHYFDEEPLLAQWFARLSVSTRRAIGDWIAQPKSAAVRERRAERFAERSLETMEAERELPPAIRSALGREPGAMRGWRSLTATQRRDQLLSIFYYRDPESRARRIEKVVELSAARAEKTGKAAASD